MPCRRRRRAATSENMVLLYTLQRQRNPRRQGKKMHTEMGQSDSHGHPHKVIKYTISYRKSLRLFFTSSPASAVVSDGLLQQPAVFCSKRLLRSQPNKFSSAVRWQSRGVTDTVLLQRTSLDKIITFFFASLSHKQLSPLLSYPLFSTNLPASSSLKPSRI